MAEDISADGRIIVGVANRAGTGHAVRWVDGGPITELAPQARNGSAHLVNAGGVAAGTISESSSGPTVPATWDRDGTIHRLDWPSPHSVWIYGIGSTGYVVGFGYLNPPKPSAVIWDPDGHLTVLPDDGQGVDVQAVDGEGTAVGTVASRATVWSRTGERVTLGTLPGGNSSSADLITDGGRVVGQATTATGKYHAVYWTLR
jgi:probable HAF family extracellular repeat protein